MQQGRFRASGMVTHHHHTPSTLLSLILDYRTGGSFLASRRGSLFPSAEVSAECARFSHGIKPALDIIGVNVLEPFPRATGADMIVRNVPVAFECRWALVLPDVREIDLLNKVTDRQNTLRSCVRCFGSRHNRPGLFLDGLRRTFAACGDGTELLRDADVLHCSTDYPILEIAHVPCGASLVYRSRLLASALHADFPFPWRFRLRSRACTASFAIRDRSAGDSFSLRAFPALLADSERSFADMLAARAIPPSFPRATAFGFFLAVISAIIRDATLDVKGKIDKTARTSDDSAEVTLPLRFIASAVSPTMQQALGCPTRNARSAQAERTEGDRQHGPAFALESNSQEHASALLTRLCPEPRKSGYLSTSCQRSNFGFAAQSLTGEQRLR